MTGSAQPSRQTQMRREIYEQPQSLRRAIAGATDTTHAIAEEVNRREIDLILIAARGTSDHAALYAQYLFQYQLGIPVALATPSVYTLYDATLRLPHALVIGISQSGEAPDVLEVMSRARMAGALTVAITNVENSPLAISSDQTLFCRAGDERSVAATKTFTTTCVLLAQLAAALCHNEQLGHAIDGVPDLVSAALACEPIVQQATLRYVHARDCVVLGRGFLYSIARETALKLEETCYVVATPFSTADFRHGPAALIERGMPVIAFTPPGRTAEQSHDLLRWLREREADCVVVGQDDALLELATVPIPLRLPALTGTGVAKNAVSVDELLAPLAYIIPGQLFALHLALHKGLDPDRPRSLTKVTYTR